MKTLLPIVCGLLLCGMPGCSSDGGFNGEGEVPVASSGKPGATAPDVFKVQLSTSQGNVVIEVHRDWSPNGADRFYELVQEGFYDECKFFRVISGFMAQVGINGSPLKMEKWGENNIPDDPVVKSNTRGYVTFAKTALPNTRSTQIFFNFGDNSQLDGQGFAPFGIVIEGMENIDALYSGYGEQPDQSMANARGNEYFNEFFPKLDVINKAEILSDESPEESAEPSDADQSSDAETSGTANDSNSDGTSSADSE